MTWASFAPIFAPDITESREFDFIIHSLRSRQGFRTYRTLQNKVGCKASHSGLAYSEAIFNPRCMYKGYGSDSVYVSVCLSVIKLADIYLVCKSKVQQVLQMHVLYGVCWHRFLHQFWRRLLILSFEFLTWLYKRWVSHAIYDQRMYILLNLCACTVGLQ